MAKNMELTLFEDVHALNKPKRAHLPAFERLDALIEIQRFIAFFILQSCVNNVLTSAKIKRSTLSEACTNNGFNPASIKTSIARLIQKGIMQRADSVLGPGGHQRFKITLGMKAAYKGYTMTGNNE